MKLYDVLSEHNVRYQHYYRSDGVPDSAELAAQLRSLQAGSYPGRYFSAGNPVDAVLYYCSEGVANLVEARIVDGLIVDSWDSAFIFGAESGEYRQILTTIDGVVPAKLVTRFRQLVERPDPVAAMGRTLHGSIPMAGLELMQQMYPYYKMHNWGEQVTLPTRNLLPTEVMGIHLCAVRTQIPIVLRTLYNAGSELRPGESLVRI